MRDDHLQGILFSKSLLLDLAPHTRYEQFATKIKDVVRVKRTAARSSLRLNQAHRISVLVGANRFDRELRELAARLKNHDLPRL